MIWYFLASSGQKKNVRNAPKLPEEGLLGNGNKKTTPEAANVEGHQNEIVKLENPITVNPKLISFEVPTKKDGSVSENLTRTVRIMNNSNMMGVFKVRTNRRKRYVVSPSVAYLKPNSCHDVQISLREKEIPVVNKELNDASLNEDGSKKKKKKDTFLVQWMNIRESFYYDMAFFDTIEGDTWLKKASHLIKKVEKSAADNEERKKYFVYEKVHVALSRKGEVKVPEGQ
eukprot:g1505.t1